MKLFDAHFHIIDHRFPVYENEGFTPDAYTCQDYRRDTSELTLVGGAIVSGSYQRFDQTYLVAALDELGPEFVGVTQLPVSVEDDSLHRLDQEGVRGVRFNLRRLRTTDIDALERFAHRIYREVGWHVEVYAGASRLRELCETLIDLPAVVIDHLGLSEEAISTLYQLIDHGAWVKASGFGRLDFEPEPVIQTILDINPRKLIVGTDLPSTRAPRKFRREDIDRVVGTVGSALRDQVLVENAANLYRPRRSPGPPDEDGS